MDCVHPFRLDLEKIEADSSYCYSGDGLFLVYSRDLVRIRLLPFHGLALPCENGIGALRYAGILPKISHSVFDRFGRESKIGGHFCRFLSYSGICNIGDKEFKRLDEQRKKVIA